MPVSLACQGFRADKTSLGVFLFLPSLPPATYWLPPLVTGGITAAIAILIVMRRPSRPGTVLALYLLAASIWSIAYCLQLHSSTLAEQILWSKVQYLGSAGVPLAGLTFVLQYTGLNDWLRANRILPLMALPVLTQVVVWTNEHHHLIWTRTWIDTSGRYLMMARTHGIWFWIFLVYSYVLILIAIILLVRELASRHVVYRSQTVVLLLGCTVPMAGNLMFSFGFEPVRDLDFTTFGFSVTGLTMAWGLFRFQLPIIMPVARQRVFEGMSDAVIVLDIGGNVVDINPKASRLLGQESTVFIGRPAASAFRLHPELVVLTASPRESYGTVTIFSSSVLRRFEVRYSPIRTQKQFLIGSLLVLHDVTERESAEIALRHAHAALEDRISERTADLSLKIEELGRLRNQLVISATHDSLTGLPNRKLFLDRVAQRLEITSTPSSTNFAILYVDLDRFKIYNDGFGHRLGDLLLIEMAGRLARCVTSLDTAARMGGDEFTVLINEVNGVDDASRIAQELLDTLAKPAHLDGTDIHLTASVGVAVGSRGFGSAAELLRDADLAMYGAKKAGGNQCVFFGESMRASALALAQLEQDLRLAVARNQIMVQYQPFVRMLTGKVVGFEALVRWRHPERGILPPAAFLPLAEQTGMLIAIDEFVLQEACRQKARWERLIASPELPPFVSVNVSGWQLAHPQRWSKALDTLESSLAGIRLEILESVLLANAHAAAEFFDHVRTHNLQIYLDDFGTGYSSLSWLSQFPIHSLKIDRSFVKEIATESKKVSIVRAIIALAKGLEIEIVAEGIENRQQFEILQELGCDYGQGFYFSPAVDGELTAAMLA